MQRITYYSVLLLAMSMCFLSCRKGDLDPSVSLYTRKMRLTGKWKLDSLRGYERISIGGDVSLADYLMLDGVKTITNISEGVHEVNQWAYQQELEITGKGAYTSTEIKSQLVSQSVNVPVPEEATCVTTGSWQWVYKSKQDSLRNKEAILLMPDQWDETKGSGTTSITYTGFIPHYPETWTLLKLKNKQLFVKLFFDTNYPGDSVSQEFRKKDIRMYFSK